MLSDFLAFLVPFESPGVTAPGVKVHQGFLRGYNAVASSIVEAMRAELQVHSDFSIVCTGHSLGGALASLCSVAMKQNFPGRPLRLFTFGESH